MPMVSEHIVYNTMPCEYKLPKNLTMHMMHKSGTTLYIQKVAEIGKTVDSAEGGVRKYIVPLSSKMSSIHFVFDSFRHFHGKMLYLLHSLHF